MQRRLARSFVVTLAIVPACNRTETATPTANPPMISSNPPAVTVPPPTSTPDPSASALVPSATASTPPPTTKKRRRTSPPAADAKWADNVPYGELVSQQPADPGGRAVFVAYDDRCYVEVPMKPPYPPMPTGARAVDTVFVDCPAAVDDPAWDTCTSSQLMLAPSKQQCFCVPLGGNPPPPPRINACPAAPKKPKP